MYQLFDELFINFFRKVMVAGGMESLSNTPFLMDRNPKYGGFGVKDSCDYDGLTDAYSGWHMGRLVKYSHL